MFQGLQLLQLRLQLCLRGNADPRRVIGLQGLALLLQQRSRCCATVVGVLPIVECANQHDEYPDVYKMRS
jgi:hypothetical protein